MVHTGSSCPGSLISIRDITPNSSFLLYLVNIENFYSLILLLLFYTFNNEFCFGGRASYFYLIFLNQINRWNSEWLPVPMVQSNELIESMSDWLKRQQDSDDSFEQDNNSELEVISFLLFSNVVIEQTVIPE